jgi:hypothetical protein
LRKGRVSHALLAEKLMAGDAEAIVSAVLTAAKNGDMTAAQTNSRLDGDEPGVLFMF